MYGHVVNEWKESLTANGMRQGAAAIKRDLITGLYFTYVRSRLSTLLEGGPEDITLCYVDPNDVRWVSDAPRSMLPRYGNDAVLGRLHGSWDRFRTPVNETETYKSIESAYRNQEHHELLDSLRDGYREIRPGDVQTRTVRGITLPDEIRLAVGRDGTLLRWSGGLNRLAAAQLIGIERIPAIIILWHADVNRADILDTYELEYDSIPAGWERSPTKA